MTKDQLKRLCAGPRSYAKTLHIDQSYGDVPYMTHLDDVAYEVSRVTTDIEVLAAAYLHDILEDTEYKTEKVAEAFGPRVARWVELVTDPPGESRAVRKVKVNGRLAMIDVPDYPALIVKVGDRLANMRRAHDGEERKFLRMYAKEYETFRAATYRAGVCDVLWDELDDLARLAARFLETGTS